MLLGVLCTNFRPSQTVRHHLVRLIVPRKVLFAHIDDGKTHGCPLFSEAAFARHNHVSLKMLPDLIPTEPNETSIWIIWIYLVQEALDPIASSVVFSSPQRSMLALQR